MRTLFNAKYIHFVPQYVYNLIKNDFVFTGDKNTQICGAARMGCLREAKRKLETTNGGKAFEEECNCMPACTSIKYNAYVGRSSLDLMTLREAGVPDE